MDNELKPAGEIVGELKRLNNKPTAWGEPYEIDDYQFVLGEIEKLDPEKPIDNSTLVRLADIIFRSISPLERKVQTQLIHEEHKQAAAIVRWTFEKKHEKKAKEAYMKERKKAYQMALKIEGLRANNIKKKCEEEVRKEIDWSWFDLKDTEHQQPFIDRKLETLKGWKDGDAETKPPTPILDRLYLTLKESGTGITLEIFVEAYTWHARYTELTTTHHTRGGPPKLRDFVNGSVLEIQKMCDVCRAHVAELDEELKRTAITQAMYDLSRNLIDNWRITIENLSPDRMKEAVDEANAIRSTKKKLEQAYESKVPVPSSIVKGHARYNGLLVGNPVDRALSRTVELPEY